MRRCRPASRFVLTYAAVISALGCQQPAEVDRSPVTPLVGPLVGHVTDHEANLWAFAGRDARFDLRYWPRDDRASVREVRFAADPRQHDAAMIRVDELEPDTAYDYRLVTPVGALRVASGVFTTAPPAGRPARFTIAAASCMHYEDDQSAWAVLQSLRPAFLLLLGDNVYSDSTSREIIWSHHIRYRQVSEFAAVVRTIPTYAIWDDHDFAGDDSSGEVEGKVRSLRAFAELWPNPAAGTDTVPGAFYRFRWADVEFFVLDCRFHRSENEAPDDDEKRMLGDGQFAWLMDGLRASTATFKVIVSSSTFRAAETDSWLNYTFSRERLFDGIMAGGVSGALIVSGDLHRCTIDVHESGETGGYPLHEIISSGITRGSPAGFATLNFDTTLDDPVVIVEIWLADGTRQDRREIRLSELMMTGSSNDEDG